MGLQTPFFIPSYNSVNIDYLHFDFKFTISPKKRTWIMVIPGSKSDKMYHFIYF